MSNHKIPDAPWGELLTADTVGNVDPTYGFPSITTGERFRPFNFSLLGDAVVVEALNTAGAYSLIDVSRIPGASIIDPRYVGNATSAPVVSLHYSLPPTNEPPSASTERVPLLAINPEPTDETPKAHFVFGEHPEYPDKGRAIYIGAVLLGHMPSRHFMPHFLTAKKRTLRYFPLPTELPGTGAGYAPEYSI